MPKHTRTQPQQEIVEVIFTRTEVWCVAEVLNNVPATTTRHDRAAYLIRKAAKNALPVERMIRLLEAFGLDDCAAPSDIQTYRPAG